MIAIHKNLNCLLLALGIICTSSSSFGQSASKQTSFPTDQLHELPDGSIKINGYLGHKIDLCIENRILVQPTDNLSGLFENKTLNPGGYLGELFGKCTAGASLAYRYEPRCYELKIESLFNKL